MTKDKKKPLTEEETQELIELVQEIMGRKAILITPDMDEEDIEEAMEELIEGKSEESKELLH